MKKLLLVLILFFAFSSINSQQRYTPITNISGWCVDEWGGGGTGSVFLGYPFRKDTVINGNKYNIYGKVDKYLRDDTLNRKVYAWDPDNKNEILLYDFNLKEGDTITINFKGYKPVLMTVSQLDSIESNGDQLIEISFSHADTVNEYGLRNTLRWIEGVGSNWHPDYINRYNLFFYGYNILCAYNDRGRFFTNYDEVKNDCGNPYSTNCNFLNTVTSPAKPQLKVYPSPFTNYFTVNAENIEETTLYDMLGRVVYHSKVKSTKPILVYFERELDAGYYQLKVKTKAGVLTQKVMKK